MILDALQVARGHLKIHLVQVYGIRMGLIVWFLIASTHNESNARYYAR